MIDTTLGSESLAQLPSPTFTYNKLRSDIVLKITYQDTIANEGPGASTCFYQLRMDGFPGEPTNQFSAPFLVASNIVNTSFGSVGIFRNLGAGPHMLSFWHRQVAATKCIRNSGGFITTITVEEIKLNP